MSRHSSFRIALSTEQKNLISSIPNWNTIPAVTRKRFTHALRITGIQTIQELLDITDEAVAMHVQGIKHRQQLEVRGSLCAIKQCWLNHELAQSTSVEQQKTVEALCGSTFSPQNKNTVAAGLHMFQITHVGEVLNIPDDVVYHILSLKEDIAVAIGSANMVFALAGRRQTVTRRMVENLKRFGIAVLTNKEVQWLQHNKDQESLYIEFRKTFADFLKTTIGLTNTSLDGQLHWNIIHGSEIARELAPKRNWEKMNCVKPQEAMQIAITFILRGMSGKNSLIGRHRQTRRTNPSRGEPGKDLCKTFGTACRRLLQFWDVSKWDMVSSRSLWQCVSQQSCDVIVELQHTPDVLTVNEMGCLEKVAETPAERLIVLLLSRLGMRIGAVRQLRISGVVDGFHELQNGMDMWTVRRFIQGVDKGNKVNEWDTCFDPVVHAELSSYINCYWRKKHEAWFCDGGKARLVQSFLFPGRKVGTGMSTPTAQNVVKNLFKRANITGSKAHAHACRKGVVTALLRAGR